MHASGARKDFGLRHAVASLTIISSLALTQSGQAQSGQAQSSLAQSGLAQPFDGWAATASAAATSPATVQTGDSHLTWTAPDSRIVSLTVKVPHPAAAAQTITLPAVPAGADARPYFDAALAQVRSAKAGRLTIPKGTYTFKTLAKNAPGHLVVEGLHDVTIDGGGSTFVFTQNQPGIYLSTSQRVELTNVTVQYSLKTASVGTIVSQNGHNVLLVDSAFPVTAADGIGHLAEYNRTTADYVLGGQRIYTPPGSSTTPVYMGNQTYSSAAFQGSQFVNRSYVVFHHWYGGIAVQIEDQPGPSQSEDIVLDHVTINSGPGMAIEAYGIKRGFGVWNSTIARTGNSPASTEYDGVHILIAGGDVSLLNNTIANQGDDAINLNEPISPVIAATPGSRTITVSTYSRFMSPGDTLAFFDGGNNYLGSASIVGQPKSIGGLYNQDYVVTLSQAVAGLTTGSYARDVALIDSRVAVMNNTIRDCQCHGILIQVPNAIIAANSFTNLAYNGIRALTDLGDFVEGAGAINVTISDNVLTNLGSDAGISGMGWAAISLYGVTASDAVSATPVNKFVSVTGNTITNAQQGCITVTSSETVQLVGNACASTNLSQPANSSSILVKNSVGVQMSLNKRSGSTTGGITVTAASTSGIAAQTGY